MIKMFKRVVFENYANFRGRASRSEYWLYSLFVFIISTLLFFLESACLISGLGGDSSGLAIVGTLVYVVSALLPLVLLIPNLAVTVRRLHDTNHSGWWFFIIFFPFVGAIWLLVLLCTGSDAGKNDYGELEE